MLEIKLLSLLIVANGLPVIMFYWMGERLSFPLDSGKRLSDGFPLFGDSKTWRGFLVGSLGTSVVAFVLGFSMVFGVVFGFLSLLGDLFSSFIKRRMKQPSSSKLMGVDQIPEAIIPLVFGVFWLGYELSTVVIVTLLFFLLNVLGSPLLYQLGIRKRPH